MPHLTFEPIDPDVDSAWYATYDGIRIADVRGGSGRYTATNPKGTGKHGTGRTKAQAVARMLQDAEVQKDLIPRMTDVQFQALTKSAGVSVHEKACA